MMARNRRYGRSRTAVLRTRAGIATAAVLEQRRDRRRGDRRQRPLRRDRRGAGRPLHPFGHEGTMLSTALTDWNSSQQGTYSQLAHMTSMRGFSQTSHHGKTLDHPARHRGPGHEPVHHLAVR